jgi:hypothetical protein
MPTRCPWCHADGYKQAPGRFGCGASYATGWNRHGATPGEPCPVIDAESATVIRDRAAETGNPLMTVLESDAQASSLLTAARATARDRRPYEPE